MRQEKLNDLKLKRDLIEAKIKALQAKDSAQKRKDETRRKILIGGMILHKVKNNEMEESELIQMMDHYLESKRDRVLFNLD